MEANFSLPLFLYLEIDFWEIKNCWFLYIA